MNRIIFVVNRYLVQEHNDKKVVEHIWGTTEMKMFF